MEPRAESTEGRSAAGPGRPRQAEDGRDEEAPDAPGRRFDFERAYVYVAVLLLAAAAALLYLARPEAAFVTAALGASAWFLGVRTGLKREHDLVKRGGRNWEPRGRGELPESDDPEDEGTYGNHAGDSDD